jgi:hypothetical protein
MVATTLCMLVLTYECVLVDAAIIERPIRDNFAALPQEDQSVVALKL